MQLYYMQLTETLPVEVLNISCDHGVGGVGVGGGVRLFKCTWCLSSLLSQQQAVTNVVYEAFPKWSNVSIVDWIFLAILFWHHSQILLRHCKYAFVWSSSLHFENFRHSSHYIYASGKWCRATNQHTADSFPYLTASLCRLWAVGCRQSIQPRICSLMTYCWLPLSCTHQLWIKTFSCWF